MNNTTAQASEIGPPVETDIEAETDLLLETINNLFPQLSEPCRRIACANVEALAALAAT